MAEEKDKQRREATEYGRKGRLLMRKVKRERVRGVKWPEGSKERVEGKKRQRKNMEGSEKEGEGGTKGVRKR